MATAPTRTSRPTHLDPTVTHPLDRLRGTIRRYVVIEGLLAAAIFVAAWFAIGLILDFVAFKLFTWDWVLDAPRWMRGVALVIAAGLLAAILVSRIATRLTKELSYPALALVLERRFPTVLGDRLITAVELADVERSASYGYSAEMVRATIAEAQERVGTVPVDRVFNWRRLRVMGWLAGGIVLAIVAVGFIAFAAGSGTANPYRFAWRLVHVGSTFVERNVFLMQTPWPRRAHIELVRFPGEELRVGKDAQAPVVRAKAFQWVVADRDTLMGWRPMLWGDLTPDMVGGPVPDLNVAALKAAAEINDLPDDPKAWPVDQIYSLAVEDAASRARLSTALGGEEYLGFGNALDRVFQGLEDQAGQPSNGRRLRKLGIPDAATLAYEGVTKTGEVSLTRQQNNEFAGAVTDLKETVQFVVRAEDFRTRPKTITLVPPPLFTKLATVEYQPAYLHHAPPRDEGYPALRGLRQRMPEKPRSLTGDRTIISVPSGTELVLTASADVDLTAAFVQPRVGILPGAKPGSADPLPVTIGDDKRSVSVEFRGEYRLAAGRVIDHVFKDDKGRDQVQQVTTTAAVEFDLIVVQGDGVTAKRQVLIQVVEDQPPSVEVAVDAIRKVGPVYYVTANARIPFNPESVVRDDHGLSKVAYDFVYWPEDSDIGRALRAQLVTRAFLYPAQPVGFPGAIATTYHAVKFKDLDKGDNRRNGSAELGRFTDARRGLLSETRPRLLDLLAKPLDEGQPELVKRIELKSPDFDYFDLKPLKLAVTGSGEVQTRYRLDLNVLATDTNFDTGPRTGQNLETIKLLIVSEGDLLAEINKEEESFAVRLDEALAKLAGAKKKFEFIRTKNGSGNRDELETARVRGQDAGQDVAKCRDIVQSVVREYRRIFRECAFNRVSEPKPGELGPVTIRFGQFGNRIDRVLGETPTPLTEQERNEVAAGARNPKTTFPIVEKRFEGIMVSLTLAPTPTWVDPAALAETGLQLDLLEQEILSIRRELGEAQTKDKLKKILAGVIEGQKRIHQELMEWQVVTGEKLKLPQIGQVGPVFLTKGESKKIKHSMSWGVYDKDDLTVKVKVYAAADKKRETPLGGEAMGVPPEIKLTFEQVSLDLAFEYAVKAGTKEGEYVIVLTPDAGAAVEVNVTVK